MPPEETPGDTAIVEDLTSHKREPPSHASTGVLYLTITRPRFPNRLACLQGTKSGLHCYLIGCPVTEIHRELSNMSRRGHVRVPNDLAQLEGITDAQLGLLVRLLSLPPGWETTTEKLVQPGDGRDKIRSGIRALEALGLVTRREFRDQSGRYRQTWVVRDSIPGTGTDSQASPVEGPENTGTDSQARSGETPAQTGTDSQARDGFSGPDRDGFSGPSIQAINTTTGDTGVAVATAVPDEPRNNAPPPKPGPEPSRTCREHAGYPSPPPCGSCADARRAYVAWETSRSEWQVWVEQEHTRRLFREREEAERRRSRDHSKYMAEIRATLSTPKRQTCYNEGTDSQDPEEGNAMIRRRKAAG